MNTKLFLAVMAAIASLAAAPAFADPDKEESGHGHSYYKHDRHHGGKGKEEFWDGNCKVERKWDRGEYKEERKCKGPRHVHHYPAEAPVELPPPGPEVVITLPPIVIR